MRHGSLLCLILAACSSGGVGDHCADQGDCDSSLQCVQNVCVPRCTRAPDCGDGYACDKDGLCRLATGQPGDSCTSEVDCAPGLACELVDISIRTGHLVASCAPENPTGAAGGTCTQDGDCRDGTCALGHCVDLCRETRDCAAGTSCTQIPRIEAMGALFGGCLQSRGTLRWTIPVSGPSAAIALPVPATARSVAVALAVDDDRQKVGAIQVVSPSGKVLVDTNPGSALDYYTSLVRHRPEFGQSVLVMPSTPSPAGALETGAYTLDVSSLRPSTTGVDLPGTETPTATAVLKLDDSVVLDLHFYFLNLDDHPCSSVFGTTLDAQLAQSATFFQEEFLGQLRSIFERGGVSIGATTYEDLRDHPELDGLDVASAPALFALGAHDTGINVFFVRTLSPVGLQAYGPNPGPAGLAGTRQSGIVVSLDTLCYRSWQTVARITAHELARYMGLYENIDLDGHPDPIDDSDAASTNLMFYSELGGGALSAGQRDILTRSAVLR